MKAGVFVPGTKKFTSVIVLPSAVKSRGELNVVKRPGYVALMLPNSTAVPEAALALTCNAVPGVDKTTPRGELTLKKLAGKRFGAEEPSGTPSQLISRRPLPKEPATLALSVPKLVRNASTVAWIPAALRPVPDVTIAPALAADPITSNA